MPRVKKGSGRLGRTIRILASISALGAGLAIYNVVTTTRDVQLAIGPLSTAQEAFFVSGAERPDIHEFFKSLTSAQRLAMAQNIGRYSDAALAKLIGLCLDTFDLGARSALTRSLSHVAHAYPGAVAEQMKLAGSFQQLAISTALRSSGASALPLVAAELKVADARLNAESYLATSGPSAVSAVLPFLDDSDKDVRLAAADTLGKLRARSAVSTLVAWYRKAPRDQQPTYLTAISGIGDPSTEPLLASALMDESLSIPDRSQAALGLGRIATTSALNLLWKFVPDERKQLRQTVISALQLAGDHSLIPGKPQSDLLLVASGVQSRTADQILRASLADPALQVEAAMASAGRPSLVTDLGHTLSTVDLVSRGDVADAMIRALMQSASGIAVLDRFRDANIRGLIERRLKLTGNG